MAKKKKKRKLKKQVKILIIIIVIAVIGIGFFLLLKPTGSKKKVNKIEVTDKIEGYGYTLNDNATSYQKKLFAELKSILESSDVNDEEYAKTMSKLFLADFYNLDNKVTKSDIGGVQFVYKSYQDDFAKAAAAGMYYYIESDIYGKRKQELPVVSSVEVADIKETPVKYQDKSDNKGYVVDLTITYQKDLGYQEDVSLTLIHTDKKLEIVNMANNKAETDVE